MGMRMMRLIQKQININERHFFFSSCAQDNIPYFDRFGIKAMKSKDKLLDLFNSRRHQLTLNEQINVMRRISQINVGESYIQMYGVDSVMKRIEIRLANVDYVEVIQLGPLVEALQNMKCYCEHKELWLRISDAIQNDRFELDPHQMFTILKGFSNFKRHLQLKHEIDFVLMTLKKVSHHIAIFLCKENKITDKKVQINEQEKIDEQEKMESQQEGINCIYNLSEIVEMLIIWQQCLMLNEQVLRLVELNLKQYIELGARLEDLEQIIRIACIFAEQKYWSESINQCIREQYIMLGTDKIDISKLLVVAVFGRNMGKQEVVEQGILGRRLEKTDFLQLGINELNIIIESLSYLKLSSIINETILSAIDECILNRDQKEYQIQNTSNRNELNLNTSYTSYPLGELMRTQQLRKYSGDKLQQFSRICAYSRMDPEEVMLFLEFINQQGIEHLFHELFNILPQYSADNCLYFDWENKCLLYYYLRKEAHQFYDFHLQNGYLNVLKEYIKLHYVQLSSSAKNRMPIPLTSNFYKILTIIDLTELFSQSHYS